MLSIYCVMVHPGPVGLFPCRNSLQITDYAAPLAACKFHQSEVGELICGGIVQ